MCDDHVDHWHKEERKSRTWKECSECDGLIAPGDRYVRLVSIDNGSAKSFAMHAPCDQIAADVADEFGEDGCRMLMHNSAAEEINQLSRFEREASTVLARLRWMRVNSRGRYGAALAQAWVAP